MLSPIYARKLEQNDFELPTGAIHIQQRDHYQKESNVVIRVKWWNEVRMRTFGIYVPND
jgi:hypothetical protein